MTSTSKNASTNEFYNPWVEHSQDDVRKVNRWEDEEQKRRIQDKIGEQQRRYIANQVSEIISTNLRPSWFHTGSSYFFSLLKVARNAGTTILRSSQIQAINAKAQITHGVEAVGNKATETAQDVKHRVEAVGQLATETAQDLKHKVEFAGHKAQETSQDVKVRIQEKIGAAQGVAQGVAHQGYEKVQEVAQKLKNVSLRLFGQVNNVFSYFSENTNLAFAVMEEENERAWRLNCELEVFAILNALRISSLFKDMAPEFYRPAFEPTRKYSTRLIEEYERSRRIFADLADRTALNNANAVASLIEQKFRAPACILPPKVEIVESITPKSSLTAAM